MVLRLTEGIKEYIKKNTLKKVFSKVVISCGTVYTLENKDCRAGPGTTWNTAHK